MAKHSFIDRRVALGAAALAAAGAGSSAAGPKQGSAPAAVFGLEPSSTADQTARLQAAIDQTAAQGATLQLPPGRYLASRLVLRPSSRISGSGAVIAASARGSLLSGDAVDGVRIDGLTLDGMALDSADGVLRLGRSRDVALHDVTIRNAAGTGLRLVEVAGRIHACHLASIKGAALWSLDAAGLDIAHNTITDCGDNAILIWRTSHGDDGTIVAFNRIARVSNLSGGSGQFGNGINVYRAGRVQVANNRITDCAYSGVRANEASNVQIVSNTVERIGEVALYLEAADERTGAAGFEGALIASNTVDTAATGIVVTNFNNGGRLAVVQGNLVRNLMRREHEPVDKRGEGIAVEADAVVSNNVIENAPTAGLMIGWGRHMREVVATGNLIRRSRIGIAVTSDAAAGQCLIANNMISEAREGAIRAMDHARAVGADLIAGKGPRHLTLTGNVAVSSAT